MALIGCLTASCSRTASTASGKDCFPPEANRWLSTNQVDDEFAGRRLKGGPLTVYLDASGSMAGYIAGASETERPLHDLIATMPELVPAGSAAPVFKTFGTRIRDLPAGGQAEVLSESFYQCRGRASADCDNSETRLDLVLKQIEGRKDDLAIVITDMWFADPGNPASGLVPLAAPLKGILASGRSIAVFGIPAPFSGKIYDLPGGGSVSFTGRRPLILLAVGSGDRVGQFGQQLNRSSSSYLARGMTTGAIKQALFTLDPSAGIAREPSPLAPGNDRRVRRATVLNAIEGVRIQQFAIERSEPDRGHNATATLPSWTGPAASSFLPHAVWQGPLASRSLVWQRLGDRCTTRDWSKPTRTQTGWTDGGPAGQKHYLLDPTSFAEQFRLTGTYLVTGEVARVSLTQPNPATQWLRDWSFSPLDPGGRAMTDGSFYRTLNLSEFDRLLENSLAAAAEEKPGPITGFTFVVKVKE
ncbi:MAG TPA: hypothetical protein VGF77_09180 [Allosphingosinicella sp.]